MTSTSVKHISECFVKPMFDLSLEAKQPIHLTPFEMLGVNVDYIQTGLLFAKPPQYENKDFSITTLLEDLQRSLSATLTHFYPLVARLATRKQDNPPSYVVYIDPVNSPGVKFIHAKAKATTSDILTPKDIPLLVHSLFDLNHVINHQGHTTPLLSIQVTKLIDGIFIGCSFNHMVTDGTSLWHFMATWSEIFRSKEYCGSISRPPVFKRWVLDGFDPIINLPYTHHDQFIEQFKTPPLTKERIFHFSSASVSKLKAKANSELNSNEISSLQAVIALMWRCVTRVRRLPHDTKTSCSLMICNRRRLNPPLSSDYFGSPIQIVKGTATAGDLMDNGLGWAAELLHETVTSHDDTAIKKLVEPWIRSPFIYKKSQMASLNAIHVGCSPRFDMYGCEFGLGKALAIRSGCNSKGDGKITMYPGREGGGSMDVEICLLPQHMIDIELDEELFSALEIN